MVAILHRELRIASRRKWTFLGRVVTSGLAFVFGLFLILAGSVRSGADGSGLFSTLVFLSFWFCLIQGVRRASGSIADEKRDGTLGLLFLTDLKPRDIVLAKLSAAAIPLIQPLLSFVPVLAISLLLGGITGGEVFRAFLVLATVLVYSISVGLLVSSFSRASESAGHGTLIFLILAVLIPPLFHVSSPSFTFSAKHFTPLTAYNTIPDPGYRVNGSDFWWSLLIANLLSVTFILLAAYFLPRRWEGRQVITQNVKGPNPRKSRRIAERRAAILDRNPGEWLAVRHSIGKFEKVFFTFFTLGLAVAAPIVARAVNDIGAGMSVLSIAALVLVIRLASQASYPLADARRSGAIEMLGTTPLNPGCLITGQIASLRNQFIPLLGLLLIASVFCAMQEGLQLTTIGLFGILGLYWGIILLIMVTVVAVGMWMGLRAKSPNIAFFKTIVFTLLVPLPILCFPFAVPIYHIVLLLIAGAQLTGRDLERLVRGEKRPIEYTPVEPVVAAPPIIRQ
jgi:ABC-type multidrug transport system permease subunit